MKNFSEVLFAQGVAVIGAGNMGAGIAQKIAQEGIPVFLCDRSQELADLGKEKIAALLREAVDRKIFDSSAVEKILARIKVTQDFQDVKDVALVIEAVFEDQTIKAKLFADLDKICQPATIFATNTSSLSVEELGRLSGRPDRFGGLHFFYHPAKNKLLEVIAAGDTSAMTEKSLWDFARIVKKIAIKTADRSGFAVNRFFVPWLNEAVRLLDEGVAGVATIEAVARETFKIGMGPFELMNVTGIPVALHAATSLGKAFGRFYEPSHRLAEQVRSGLLWSLKGDVEEGKKTAAVRERLLGCVFQVAASLVDEGVSTREDTDRGATVGLRWGEGPFQMMNGVGTAGALALVEKFCARYDDLSVPSSLKALASTDSGWTLSYLDMTVDDGVARIAFNRPEAMNALNPRVAAELKRRFEEAERDPQVKTIVFEGIGKAFVAGADIRFFVEALDAKDFSRILQFTKEGQDLFKNIACSSKLTVAFVNGIAYGGGAELALACQKLVIGPAAQFAFPETGIGIYPGLGGTQRLPRKISKELARHLIFTGQSVGAADAIAIGLADASLCQQECQALDDKARAQACAEAARNSKSEAAGTLPVWARAARLLFSDENVESTLSGQAPALSDSALQGSADRTLKILYHKAPVALRIAARLINDSSRPSLDEGLDMELSFLQEIFATEDAYEGLSSMGKRRPVYKGR